MEKRILIGSIISVVILVLVSFTSVIGYRSVESSVKASPLFSMRTLLYNGDILYVGGSGPGNYSKIQDAINDSNDGDTVFVYNGTYYENVVVDKSINLTGEDRNTTVIDGGQGGDVILINADTVFISEFSIRNSGNNLTDTGINLKSNSSVISRTIITENQNGIRLQYSNNNTIFKNFIYINYNGICAYDSNNNIFSNNDLIGQQNDVICLTDSEHSVISENTFFKNRRCIYLQHSIDNIISYNSFEYNTGICIEPSSYSTLNLINSNLLVGNYMECMYLGYSYYNIISNNEFKDNRDDAIRIQQSSDNYIFENILINNTGVGIELFSSSDDNYIYHNNFINNTQNAYDECNNTWDNGYPSCGNYWDDYSGVDNFSGSNQDISGPDDIGDTPYSIPGGENKDRYPLMKSYGMTKLSLNFRGRLFKFSGDIKNIGNNTALNVQWKITIDGGFILLGRESSDTIPKPLLVGEETKVSSKLVLGFGRIIITIAVWADNAPLISESIPGTLLLIFLML